MKSFLETVIGGAIGMIALYVVGKVAYQAGKEVAKAECEYEALRKDVNKGGSGTTVTHGVNQDGEEVSVVWERTDADSKQIPVRVPMKRSGKLSTALNAVKLLRRKDSVIGDLVKHPEAHKIEAFVEGDNLRINVCKRPAFA